MTSLGIKAELQQMIALETDVNLLNTVYEILSKASTDLLLKEKLVEQALKSEEDIKAGRVFTREQVLQRIMR